MKVHRSQIAIRAHHPSNYTRACNSLPGVYM
jgi:hypothetical protein